MVVDDIRLEPKECGNLSYLEKRCQGGEGRWGVRVDPFFAHATRALEGPRWMFAGEGVSSRRRWKMKKMARPMRAGRRLSNLLVGIK